MKEYIKKYIDQGFAVFPCNSDKTPMTSKGFYTATTDIKTLELQFYKDDLLIGFPTGWKNGIAVIDFDVNKEIPGTEDIDPRSVEELIEEIENNYGELPDTFKVLTPSGGMHYYYLMPKDFDLRSGRRVIDKSLPVDARANGGYVIAPDGVNYIVYDDIDDLEIENLIERCAPLPEWIIHHRKKQSEEKQEVLPESLPPEEVREIRSALSFLSSDDRDTWIEIGLALKSTGSPSAFGLWQEWSKTSPKYNPEDMEKRWAGLKPKDKTIASLFFEAKRFGWTTTYAQNPPQQQLIVQTTEEKEEKKELREQFKMPPFPKELLYPGGLVEDIASYIMDKSIMPQPIFALSGALCALGAIAGRKYQTINANRTNIYCINVGESGCGKEAPRKAIKDLFHYSGIGELSSVGKLASDVAIETELKRSASQVFLLDEIGRVIETTKNGPSHLSSIITTLLELYNSANQTYYGKSYADAEKKPVIEQPNLCIMGTTVPDTLYKGLTIENATDGFLSRVLIFETDDQLPEADFTKDITIKPPPGLINDIQKIVNQPINVKPEGNLDGILHPDPFVVKRNEEANEIFMEFYKHIRILRLDLKDQDRIDAMFNRTVQMADQISLILAIGANPEHPVVTAKEMLYSVRLTKYISENMQNVIENHMARNEYEHEVKRVLAIIRKAGSISLTEITKKTQNLTTHHRNDVLATLINSGQAREELVGVDPFVMRMFKAI